MADETGKTGRDGASNTPPVTADAQGTPEPVILEEHVLGTQPSTQQPPPKDAIPGEKVPSPSDPTPQAAGSVVRDGISNIAGMLKMIKLPERHTQENKEPQRKYDTALVTDTPGKNAERAAALQNAAATASAINENLSKVSTPVDDVRALHTLKDDLQHVVRDKKISLVRAVALEEEKRHRSTEVEEEFQPLPQQRPQSRYSIVLIGTLVLLGSIAIGAVLFVMAQRSGQAAAPITAAVLFAEQNAPLPIDNLAPTDIRREIGNARTSAALTLGAILEIVPVTQQNVNGEPQMVPVTFSQFLEKIGTKAPAELPRALADQFFLGLHTVDENAPLIVIPVTSYERAFAAMLEWEKTMNADLSPMFTAVSPQSIGPDGLPTVRRFEDAVIRNYDVRALKDDSGTIQLYYSFPTRNVLIIAESPYSFPEILSRLRADRKL